MPIKHFLALRSVDFGTTIASKRAENSTFVTLKERSDSAKTESDKN